ncbi:MAG: DUF6172 family protein, partial [Porticoccaceae bacterium]|nr:DUF6172 family protein [Porticoccaceae bacterium]
ETIPHTAAVHPSRILMKKTFKLEHPKIKVPRVVDSVKHDIRKFLKKERAKSLPSGAKYWGFDCKFGESEETAIEVHLPSLTKNIDEFVAKGITILYVEINAKAMGGEEIPAAEGE